MILAKYGDQILGGPDDRGRIALRWYRIRLSYEKDSSFVWKDYENESSSLLIVGSRVKLRGLVKKMILNGRVGTVTDLDFRKTGNLAVRLDACSWDRDRLLQIRRINVSIATIITDRKDGVDDNEEVEITFDTNSTSSSSSSSSSSSLGKVKESLEFLDNDGGFYQPSVDDVGTRICLRVQGLGENSSIIFIFYFFYFVLLLRVLPIQKL